MHERTEIEFRIARVEEIIDLRWTILRAGLPRGTAQFDGDDEPTTLHFAACLNDKPIACVTFLRRPFDDQPAWQLRGMAVQNGFQGSGIGGRLLDFAEPIVLDHGHSRLFWCNARVPAARFYEKRGWRVVGDPFDIPAAGPHVKMVWGEYVIT